MKETIFGKEVDVVKSKSLYTWAKVWGKVQKGYYRDKVILRREKQILDFVKLNEFNNVYIEKDTDILSTLVSVSSPESADLVIVTDQKMSRLPCNGMVERIQQLLGQCPKLLLCVNRHYINIDNSFKDDSLDDSYTLAITQWLKKSLPGAKVLDLSLDYLDRGDWFTWVVPDRIYYIEAST